MPWLHWRLSEALPGANWSARGACAVSAGLSLAPGSSQGPGGPPANGAHAFELWHLSQPLGELVSIHFGKPHVSSVASGLNQLTRSSASLALWPTSARWPIEESPVVDYRRRSSTACVRNEIDQFSTGNASLQRARFLQRQCSLGTIPIGWAAFASRAAQRARSMPCT